MGAGGVDAFAATVGEGRDRGRAEDLDEPAGQVAAQDVAIRGQGRPARDEAQGDDGARVEGAAGRIGDGILKVQQAKVVLPPLAQDDAAAALSGVGEEAGEFGFDLALQMAESETLAKLA